MNWEIGIDMYTQICIKWMTNNLLYKKVNKIKFKNSKKTMLSKRKHVQSMYFMIQFILSFKTGKRNGEKN